MTSSTALVNVRIALQNLQHLNLSSPHRDRVQQIERELLEVLEEMEENERQPRLSHANRNPEQSLASVLLEISEQVRRWRNQPPR